MMTYKSARLPGVRRRHPIYGLLAFILATTATAQVAPTMDRRPQATRAELEASLVEIEKIIGPNSIYGESIKQQKQAEAVMIRSRLRDGDFQVGDQLTLTLSVPTTPNGPPITNLVVAVGPDQMLQLPDLPVIPLRGVLRSEIKDYLTEYLGRLFRDQSVLVVPTIRLTILGGIGSPGFYQIPADTPLPDAIMLAGGITGGTELNKTVIKRAEEELWSEEEMARAITAATTLDQLNLRSGDELIVGQKTTINWFTKLRTYAIIPGLILSLAGLGRLFGII